MVHYFKERHTDIKDNICVQNVIFGEEQKGEHEMVTTPIRKKEDIDLAKKYFLKEEKYRDYSLFIIGINTSLRISDILKLRWYDVYDFENQKFREHLIIQEQKTGKTNCVAINNSCKEALLL